MTGIAAFAASVLLLVVAGPAWSALPLAGFVLLCLVAPFLTGTGFFLPVVSRGDPSGGRVALTIDDGPDPEATPLVLDLLARHGVAATFFVLGRNAAAHPGLIARILASGHTLGNHTFTHDPLIMLRSARRLEEEILGTQAVLARHGARPLVFRPPAGILGPRLGPVLSEWGMTAVTFNRRALDRGNRRMDGLASRILARIRPGDIVMIHDLTPPPGKGAPSAPPGLAGAGSASPVPEALACLAGEIDALLRGIKARGLTVVPLAELIGRPVMAPALRPDAPHPTGIPPDTSSR
jgi:peptidoglycan/xylan/chitin deacetylase (PgdA/CDA1 family)